MRNPGYEAIRHTGQAMNNPGHTGSSDREENTGYTEE
jgi:hypothetical protein